MLEEINHLIKPDSESQGLFKSFKNDFKAKEEKLAKSSLKRARVTALVLGGTSVLAILFFVYAFTVIMKVEEEKVKYEAQVQTLETKLEGCSSN